MSRQPATSSQVHAPRSQEHGAEAWDWKPQPKAEALLYEFVADFLGRVPAAASLSRRLDAECGVRFVDLIDTVFVARDDPRVGRLVAAGWAHDEDRGPYHVHRNALGQFPQIAVCDNACPCEVAIDLKVESVVDFLAAHGQPGPASGAFGSGYRWAKVCAVETHACLGVVERHGWRGFTAGSPQRDAAAVAKVAEMFRLRRRRFGDDDADGFAHADALMDEAIALVGRDAACDLWFAAEREYWQRRNRAARVQKARQDRLGIGWANHDHHTYRSSRRHFARLVAMWEKLGFVCRERFYAGAEAGWGAQVMEHATCGLVTFNDVDLSPDELRADFAHEPLPERDALGTVGLWCGLHGESFLEAGMHHLECQFDFDSLSRQLDADAGVKVMKPFTNFSYLKQAFTEGERWPVRREWIDRLRKAGRITEGQAAMFRHDGAIGSHLENLERNEGFKGFNQKGVSEIIAATDPRKQSGAR